MSYTQRIIDPYGYGAAMLARQKSQEAGMPLSFYSNGRQYTLKPDLQMQARLEAGEKEAARRSGRKEQKILPTFRYVDPSGKRFEGTWMGGGSYGGFGGGGPQSSQRSWDNYVEPVGPRNPDYIARYGFKSMNSVGGPQPAQKPEPQRTPTPRIPPMPVGSYMSDQYGFGYSSQPMGFGGSEAAFTPAGSAIGMRPSPTATATPPPFPELPNYSSLTGFGGYLTFPYANY